MKNTMQNKYKTQFCCISYIIDIEYNAKKKIQNTTDKLTIFIIILVINISI